MTSDAPAREIRAITTSDADALRLFFATVPEGDRTFFREDVLAPGTIERWFADPSTRRLAAVVDGRIGAYAAILPGVAWSRHVGEVRLVVSPEQRGKGLGRALARATVVEAVGLGLTKLVVEVVAEQQATVSMFTGMGFEAEGLLRDHVRSQSGEVHDLLVLSHFVDALWSSMSTAGIDDALGDGDTG